MDKNIEISYTIVRSRRRTLAIHITKEATVEVRAPLKLNETQIHQFVLSKQEWIMKHLVSQNSRIKEREKFALNYDDFILFMGVEFPIFARNLRKAEFIDKAFCLPPNLSTEEIKKKIINIYKNKSKQIINDKVSYFASKMGVIPTSVKINSAKTRWGSCSGKNSLNFTWKLIMAVDCIIDYVVVHELAHIKEHNHSKAFWNIVAMVLPDFMERRKKLKTLQARLTLEDW